MGTHHPEPEINARSVLPKPSDHSDNTPSLTLAGIEAIVIVALLIIVGIATLLGAFHILPADSVGIVLAALSDIGSLTSIIVLFRAFPRAAPTPSDIAGSTQSFKHLLKSLLAYRYPRRVRLIISACLILTVLTAALFIHRTLSLSLVDRTGYTGTLVTNDLFAHDSQGKGSYFQSFRNTAGTGACTLLNAPPEYQITAPKPGFEQRCLSSVGNLSNFALAVQMTIVQTSQSGYQDGGGIIFCARASTSYQFVITRFGEYHLVAVDNVLHASPRVLFAGFLTPPDIVQDFTSRSFNITIVHDNELIEIWLNEHLLARVTDTTYPQGYVGLFAANSSNSADGSVEVAFLSGRLWQI